MCLHIWKEHIDPEPGAWWAGDTPFWAGDKTATQQSCFLKLHVALSRAKKTYHKQVDQWEGESRELTRCQNSSVLFCFLHSTAVLARPSQERLTRWSLSKNSESIPVPHPFTPASPSHGMILTIALQIYLLPHFHPIHPVWCLDSNLTLFYLISPTSGSQYGPRKGQKEIKENFNNPDSSRPWSHVSLVPTWETCQCSLKCCVPGLKSSECLPNKT